MSSWPAAVAGVVLAAGAGTRLQPLTSLRPKAVCPVDGVPLVHLALGRVSGCSSVAVNAHHLADQVDAAVGERAYLSVEDEPLGTAGALGRLRPWIEGRDVLVTNADAYLSGKLPDLTDGWDGRTCRLLGVELPETADFGRWRYVGVALLPASAVAGLQDEPSGLYEVLWRQWWQQGRLEMVPFHGQVVDCGTPADYLRANLHASGGVSVVGEGAMVAGRLTRSVVWDGAVVGADEHLVDAIRAGTAAAPMTVLAG